MKKLEVYIHIPFCVKKCDYCDFLSGPSDAQTMSDYVSALCTEMELSREKFREYCVDTIYIGGGTPSILDETLIAKILDTLRGFAHVDPASEISIECNPGTLTKEKLETYKKAGINRISLGLQSANNHELKSIGRIHSYDEFVESFKLAREVGFDNINVDLMSALPNQSLETYKMSLKKVIALNPEHISAYSLIVEDDTPLKDKVFNNEVTLPGEDVEREMYYLTKELLEKSSYNRYEISNYAKEGYECRHNVGYWKRVEYIGFGVGGATLYQNLRYSNLREVIKYIAVLDEYADVEQLKTDVEVLSENDQMEEFMFLGLRMIDGISKADFKKQFERTIESVYGEAIEKLKSQELLIEEGDKIRLTERGIDISNIVLANFLI